MCRGRGPHQPTVPLGAAVVAVAVVVAPASATEPDSGPHAEAEQTKPTSQSESIAHDSFALEHAVLEGDFCLLLVYAYTWLRRAEFIRTA